MARIDESLDEATVSRALRQLGAPQPASPADRLDAVTSRARSIHRRRTSVATLAGVMIIALSTMIISSWPTAPPQQTLVGTPLAAWPDRSQPEEWGVADGAVREWSRRTGTASPNVRWLYRGTIVANQPNLVYVAVFVAPADGTGQQLVLAHANRGQLDSTGSPVNPTDGQSPWVIRNIPTPSTSAPIHVGAYFPPASPFTI